MWHQSNQFCHLVTAQTCPKQHLCTKSNGPAWQFELVRILMLAQYRLRHAAMDFL